MRGLATPATTQIWRGLETDPQVSSVVELLQQSASDPADGLTHGHRLVVGKPFQCVDRGRPDGLILDQFDKVLDRIVGC